MIFACYRLDNNKFMSDGTEIPNDQNLYCIKSEDDILFLLFENILKKSFKFNSFIGLYYSDKII